MGESDSRGKWTRRRFLETVGRASGGAAAVYESMVALGMLRVPAAAYAVPQIAEGSGSGRTIVILRRGRGRT